MPKRPGRASSPTRASTAVAGAVALVGRPNVGKSTLLNALVGHKLAIVTPKPQTTRNKIRGVWTGVVDHREAQMVFVDTPGLHEARSPLNRFMAREAMEALEEVDAVVLVIDVGGGRGAALPAGAERLDAQERRILDRVREAGRPVILALNKVDRLKDKAELLPVLEALAATSLFAALVPISARRGQGVEGLRREIARLLPEGPPSFDADTLTDRTERFLASELVREQVFLMMRQELPYATAVVVENWEEREDKGDVVIDAAIIVEREGQKGIMVGKGGAMIRDVGAKARQEVSRLLGRPAHLRLKVRVEPEWTASERSLARAGYGGKDEA